MVSNSTDDATQSLSRVRIVAEVLRDPASTRATGTVTSELGEFNPLYLADHDYERDIYYAALYVLQEETTPSAGFEQSYKIVHKLLYLRPEMRQTDTYLASGHYTQAKANGSAAAGAPRSEWFDSEHHFSVNQNGHAEMELELEPGTYDVVFVTNSPAFNLSFDPTEGDARIAFGPQFPTGSVVGVYGSDRDYKSSFDDARMNLLYSTESFVSVYPSAPSLNYTTQDLKIKKNGIPYYMIPTTGRARIVVTPNGLATAGSDEANKVDLPKLDADGKPLDPSAVSIQYAHIKLERVMARIDVTLTTADEELKEYIHADAKDAEVIYRPEDYKLSRFYLWLPASTYQGSTLFPETNEFSFHPASGLFTGRHGNVPYTIDQSGTQIAFHLPRYTPGKSEDQGDFVFIGRYGRVYAGEGVATDFDESNIDPVRQIAFKADEFAKAGINDASGRLSKMYKRSLIMDTSDGGQSYQEASVYTTTRFLLPGYEDQSIYTRGGVLDASKLAKARTDVLAAHDLLLTGVQPKFEIDKYISLQESESTVTNSGVNILWGLDGSAYEGAQKSMSFIALEFTHVKTGEKLLYGLPITNGPKLRSEAEQYFSIRRNTVYQYDLTFTGRELRVTTADITYTVEPWDPRDVQLPVFD